LAAQPGGDATTRGTDAGAAAAAPDTVGVVLAGGASRRMGRDKAALAVDGETLAARAARRLLGVCARVAIADGGRGLVPGLPCVPDAPAPGPAAGILGAARAWPGHPLLVLACDLPRVSAALLRELVRRLPVAEAVEAGDAGDAGEAGVAGTAGDPGAAAGSIAAADAGAAADPDWVVPRWERGLEPLCALYRPAALSALAAAVERGIAAPHRLAEAAGLRIRFLEGERLRRCGEPADLFLNLNTADDLERWLRLEERR
jgi:molybdopterin-guanine dinucleotide biosynthesis protein A